AAAPPGGDELPGRHPLPSGSMRLLFLPLRAGGFRSSPPVVPVEQRLRLRPPPLHLDLRSGARLYRRRPAGSAGLDPRRRHLISARRRSLQAAAPRLLSALSRTFSL